MMGIYAFKKNTKPYGLKTLNENQLRWGAIKIILDDTTGRLHPSQSELNAMVYEVHQAGQQIAIHALEEKAVKAACEAIQFAIEKSPAKDHRHRIEHCAVCPPDLARKIASLGITVVTQPAFIYFHGERYLDTVPHDQLKHLYPIRTLLDHGINVAASSSVDRNTCGDAPIEFNRRHCRRQRKNPVHHSDTDVHVECRPGQF
jgi:predicted amidohydrolase YtcJ